MYLKLKIPVIYVKEKSFNKLIFKFISKIMLFTFSNYNLCLLLYENFKKVPCCITIAVKQNVQTLKACTFCYYIVNILWQFLFPL